MKYYYHLSYDAIDVNGPFFEGSEKARKRVECILAETGVESIDRYAASTFVISYEIEEDSFSAFNSKFYAYLKRVMSPNYNYVISLARKYTDGKMMALPRIL